MVAPPMLAVVATETWAFGCCARSASRNRPTKAPYAGTNSPSSSSTSTLMPSTPISPANLTSDAMTLSWVSILPPKKRWFRSYPKLV